MITYTIVLISDAATVFGPMPLLQEVLEAAGRRFSFGFRWRPVTPDSPDLAETASRCDAILLGHGNFIMPAEVSQRAFGPHGNDAAAWLNAGCQLLEYLGQYAASKAVDAALAAEAGRAGDEGSLGAAILLAL